MAFKSTDPCLQKAAADEPIFIEVLPLLSSDGDEHTNAKVFARFDALRAALAPFEERPLGGGV